MRQDRKAAMYGKTGIAIAALTLGMLAAAGVAHAEEPGMVPSHPMMTDRYYLSLGWFFGDSNTQANANSGTVGVGTFIDFENDLGLDERKGVPNLAFRMRLSRRWRLEADYVKTKREKETLISRQINFRDLSIPVNAQVNSDFNYEDIRVGFGYSFFRSADKEVGIGLGIHETKIEASLSTPSLGRGSSSVSAPLPTISIYSDIALTDRWLLSMRLDRLSVGIGDTDGSVSNTALTFIYQPWRHFNLGFGYRDISTQISSTSEDWRGSAIIEQRGPLLFVGTTF